MLYFSGTLLLSQGVSLCHINPVQGTLLVTKEASPLQEKRIFKMNEYTNILLKTSLFSNITADDTVSVLDCLSAVEKKYKKGECILMAGNTTEYMGLLLSGKAIVIREDYWGGQSVMSAILPGHTFAESYACTPGSVLNVSVYAEASCTVLFLNVRKMLTTCPSTCSRHSQMIRNLLSDLAEKNLKLGEKSTHMSKRTTREKILSYLSSEMNRQKSLEFDIPFTRQQLADYLAVDRSGLSTELGKMRDEGMLDFNKSHFILKSPDEGWTDVPQ